MQDDSASLSEKLREKERAEENVFFGKRDRALVEEMGREKDESEREELRELARMRCPDCGASLERAVHYGITIEQCPRGHGLWYGDRAPCARQARAGLLDRALLLPSENGMKAVARSHAPEDTAWRLCAHPGRPDRASSWCVANEVPRACPSKDQQDGSVPRAHGCPDRTGRLPQGLDEPDRISTLSPDHACQDAGARGRAGKTALDYCTLMVPVMPSETCTEQ